MELPLIVTFSKVAYSVIVGFNNSFCSISLFCVQFV